LSRLISSSSSAWVGSGIIYSLNVSSIKNEKFAAPILDIVVRQVDNIFTELEYQVIYSLQTPSD
jgi:hypothetical protein